MTTSQSALVPIYDAAINPEHWDLALTEAYRSVGAASASMHIAETGARSLYSLNCTVGALLKLSPEQLAYYVDNLSHHEKTVWDYMAVKPARTIATDEQIWPDIAATRQRPDFAFLEKHTGIYHRIAARLNDNASWFDAIAFQFDNSVTTISRSSIDGFQLLLPHLAKSCELGRAYRQLYAQYKAVLSALDHVGIGMCVVDGNGSVVVANREAERISDLNDGIAISRARRIACRNQAAQLTIHQAMSELSLTAAGQQAESDKTVLVTRPSRSHPFIVEIAPLRDALSELDTALVGTLVTIIDPDNPRPFDMERVAIAYKLTNVETAVCRYLVDGWSNANIAEDRNVSPETIKTQVTSIMQKTNTTNRAELIRLVVKTSPPVL